MILYFASENKICGDELTSDDDNKITNNDDETVSERGSI